MTAIRQTGIMVAVALLLVLFQTAGAGAQSKVDGSYIKDDRKLDEIGLKSVINVKSAWGGKLTVEMTIENPALCGGAIGGETVIKNSKALVVDDDCRLLLAFNKNSIVVTNSGSEPCMAEKCRPTGTYYRYGTLSAPVPALIDNVRRHYKYINENLDNFDSLDRKLTGFSTEGGVLKSYIYLDYIKKMVVELYGEMGKTLEEYYFFDEDLLFHFNQVTYYDAPMSGKAESVEENRYYFHQGVMIRWLTNDRKDVSPKTNEFLKMQKKILYEAGQFKIATGTQKDVVDLKDLK